MPVLSVKYLISIVLSVLLIFAPFITAWQHLLLGVMLGLILLLFGLAATSYTIVRKYRQSSRQAEIPLSVSIRNICLEIAAVLATMVLAGLIGHYLSGLFAWGMSSDLQKFIAGVGMGLLVGWMVGLLVKNISGRLMKSLSGR